MIANNYISRNKLMTRYDRVFWLKNQYHLHLLKIDNLYICYIAKENSFINPIVNPSKSKSQAVKMAIETFRRGIV